MTPESKLSKNSNYEYMKLLKPSQPNIEISTEENNNKIQFDHGLISELNNSRSPSTK